MDARCRSRSFPTILPNMDARCRSLSSPTIPPKHHRTVPTPTSITVETEDKTPTMGSDISARKHNRRATEGGEQEKENQDYFNFPPDAAPEVPEPAHLPCPTTSHNTPIYLTTDSQPETFNSDGCQGVASPEPFESPSSPPLNLSKTTVPILDIKDPAQSSDFQFADQNLLASTPRKLHRLSTKIFAVGNKVIITIDTDSRPKLKESDVIDHLENIISESESIPEEDTKRNWGPWSQKCVDLLFAHDNEISILTEYIQKLASEIPLKESNKKKATFLWQSILAIEKVLQNQVEVTISSSQILHYIHQNKSNYELIKIVSELKKTFQEFFETDGDRLVGELNSHSVIQHCISKMLWLHELNNYKGISQKDQFSRTLELSAAGYIAGSMSNSASRAVIAEEGPNSSIELGATTFTTGAKVLSTLGSFYSGGHIPNTILKSILFYRCILEAHTAQLEEPEKKSQKDEELIKTARRVIDYSAPTCFNVYRRHPSDIVTADLRPSFPWNAPQPEAEATLISALQTCTNPIDAERVLWKTLTRLQQKPDEILEFLNKLFQEGIISQEGKDNLNYMLTSFSFIYKNRRGTFLQHILHYANDKDLPEILKKLSAPTKVGSHFANSMPPTYAEYLAQFSQASQNVSAADYINKISAFFKAVDSGDKNLVCAMFSVFYLKIYHHPKLDQKTKTYLIDYLHDQANNTATPTQDKTLGGIDAHRSTFWTGFGVTVSISGGSVGGAMAAGQKFSGLSAPFITIMAVLSAASSALKCLLVRSSPLLHRFTSTRTRNSLEDCRERMKVAICKAEENEGTKHKKPCSSIAYFLPPPAQADSLPHRSSQNLWTTLAQLKEWQDAKKALGNKKGFEETTKLLDSAILKSFDSMLREFQLLRQESPGTLSHLLESFHSSAGESVGCKGFLLEYISRLVQGYPELNMKLYSLYAQDSLIPRLEKIYENHDLTKKKKKDNKTIEATGTVNTFLKLEGAFYILLKEDKCSSTRMQLAFDMSAWLGFLYFVQNDYLANNQEEDDASKGVYVLPPYVSAALKDLESKTEIAHVDLEERKTAAINHFVQAQLHEVSCLISRGKNDNTTLLAAAKASGEFEFFVRAGAAVTSGAFEGAAFAVWNCAKLIGKGGEYLLKIIFYAPALAVILIASIGAAVINRLGSTQEFTSSAKPWQFIKHAQKMADRYFAVNQLSALHQTKETSSEEELAKQLKKAHQDTKDKNREIIMDAHKRLNEALKTSEQEGDTSLAFSAQQYESLMEEIRTSFSGLGTLSQDDLNKFVDVLRDQTSDEQEESIIEIIKLLLKTATSKQEFMEGLGNCIAFFEKCRTSNVLASNVVLEKCAEYLRHALCNADLGLLNLQEVRGVFSQRLGFIPDISATLLNSLPIILAICIPATVLPPILLIILLGFGVQLATDWTARRIKSQLNKNTYGPTESYGLVVMTATLYALLNINSKSGLERFEQNLELLKNSWTLPAVNSSIFERLASGNLSIFPKTNQIIKEVRKFYQICDMLLPHLRKKFNLTEQELNLLRLNLFPPPPPLAPSDKPRPFLSDKPYPFLLNIP